MNERVKTCFKIPGQLSRQYFRTIFVDTGISIFSRWSIDLFKKKKNPKNDSFVFCNIVSVCRWASFEKKIRDGDSVDD